MDVCMAEAGEEIALIHAQAIGIRHGYWSVRDKTEVG
jgi:hypothetical protein